jgi:hypothetical protein
METSMLRRIFIISLTAGFISSVPYAIADNSDNNSKHPPKSFHATLTGFQEAPNTLLTSAKGQFSATLSKDGNALDYELEFSKLTGTITQAHIHLGRTALTGGIMVWLCQTATNPDPDNLAPQCPQEGKVSGTLTKDNVRALTAQGLAAGDFNAFITVLAAGSGYANVHTDRFPTGEIRGNFVRSWVKD